MITYSLHRLIERLSDLVAVMPPCETLNQILADYRAVRNAPEFAQTFLSHNRLNKIRYCCQGHHPFGPFTIMKKPAVHGMRAPTPLGEKFKEYLLFSTRMGIDDDVSINIVEANWPVIANILLDCQHLLNQICKEYLAYHLPVYNSRPGWARLILLLENLLIRVHNFSPGKYSPSRQGKSLITDAIIKTETMCGDLRVLIRAPRELTLTKLNNWKEIAFKPSDGWWSSSRPSLFINGSVNRLCKYIGDLDLYLDILGLAISLLRELNPFEPYNFLYNFFHVTGLKSIKPYCVEKFKYYPGQDRDNGIDTSGFNPIPYETIPIMPTLDDFNYDYETQEFADSESRKHYAAEYEEWRRQSDDWSNNERQIQSLFIASLPIIPFIMM